MFTLQEALEAIKGKTEFVCNEREFGFVIDYNVSLKDTFIGSTQEQTRILQNLRGTCFDKDGKIIRLAYHKFHNLNENEEYAARNFDFQHDHVIQTKLDGSMVTPIPHDGGWKLATRAGFTDVAKKAEQFLIEVRDSNWVKFNEYDQLIMDCLYSFNVTPIFEFCSRAQRIVIDYPTPQLILTDIRSNVNGEYLPDDMIDLIAKDYVDRVENVVLGHTVEQLAAFVREWKDREGVVVKFVDGRFVKIKAEDYVLKHRALDGLRFEKDVLALILKNEIDDVLPLVTPEVKERLLKYQESVNHFINMHQGVMVSVYNEFEKNSNDRREFALLAQASAYKTGLFKMFEGKAFSLRGFAQTKTGSSSSVEEIRWLIGPSYDNF